jgi:hypothetical protein
MDKKLGIQRLDTFPIQRENGLMEFLLSEGSNICYPNKTYRLLNYIYLF